MRRLATAAVLFLAAACTTAEKKETVAPPPVAPKIDLLAVQHDLAMSATSGEVGYREKRFDACRMAADLPAITDCTRAYFVQIGIQLSCRPTEEADGNVLAKVDLTPVRNRELRWVLGELSGRTRSDPAGFALMLAIAPRSMKKEGLRVSTGEDYLMIRAGQATSIVTPVSWCE